MAILLRKGLIPVLALALGAACSSPEKKSEQPEPSGVEARKPAQPETDPAFAQDVKDEVMVGRGIASKLLGTFGYYEKNPGLEKYLNLVGLSVAAVSGRPELNYHFAVLDTAEVNAFATPGGYIFVTRGLLRQVRNENELACVLAHEIAHVNLMHMYKQIKVKREIGAGEILARAMSRGGADIGGALSEIISKGVKMLVEDGLGQEKEFEADATGIVFAAAAGYDPSALARLVARLDQAKAGVKVAKTHPVSKERVAALEKAMTENGLAAQSAKLEDVLARRFAAASAGKHK